MIDIAQIDPDKLEELDADRLRELTRALLEHRGRELAWRDAKIDKLTFELAQLKRLKFERTSEQMNAEQRALFDEAVDGDIAALDEQLAALLTAPPTEGKQEKKTPRRTALTDRVVVMSHGGHLMEGRPHEVQQSPLVRAAYLGEVI